VETSELLAAVQEIEKRAERVSDAHVTETYVSLGSLADALASRDNGIVFGRRGTGKTHALKYLAGKQKESGDLVIYVDMEQDLGSTESIYGDSGLAATYRATRLLIDLLGIIHDRLLEDAFYSESDSAIEILEKMLDHFAEVIVADHAEQEISETDEKAEEVARTRNITISRSPLSWVKGGKHRKAEKMVSRVKVSGPVRPRVHFGALRDLMRQALECNKARRCWILLDEWSGLPKDLQPFVAEMLRKLFFGIPQVTIRLAAIPHRSEWRLTSDNGTSYVGVEVGSELFALLDLDEFVVFPARNRQERARRSSNFFKELLLRHLNYILASRGDDLLESSEQLVRLLFTQVTAFQEMIRAAEGVPRDALLIVSRAALRAGSRRISTDDIRQAAAQLFQTGKAALLNGIPEARELLDGIITDVLSGKKARGFLLSQDQTDHPLIQRLVDDRILHIIKRGYSSKYEAGARFDVLQLDYGCYVQYLSTTSAPQQLFGADGPDDDSALAAMFGSVEVPEDDYRAIRKAVLDLPEMLSKISMEADTMVIFPRMG
jgi:hypothetical protein